MIIGTAGHIDHGKTALVRALTGVDTDRLPEEKARGISIELGYAYQPLPGGGVLGFIDVPGHERFVHTMLAGASGIDFALLVIAADDGVMPQTVEHLEILDLLGVGHGAVAISKIDRVDAKRVAEVVEDVDHLFAPTRLAGAPFFPVCAPTGQGVDALRRFLHSAAAAWRAPRREEHFRLAVDRSFTLPGLGTVVTGTVFAGQVRVGDELILSPAGTPVRVRSLHVQDRPAEAGGRGERCALALAGLARDQVGRGDWLLSPELHRPTDRLDLRLGLSRREGKALADGTPVHLHLGAAHRTGRLALLEGPSLPPGGRMFAQLVLDRPLHCAAGDIAVLRDAGAGRTLGGGPVVDPWPPARYRRRPERLEILRAMGRAEDADALADLAEAAETGVDLTAFARGRNRFLATLPLPAGSRRVGERLFAAAVWRRLGDKLLAGLGEFHARNPDEAGPQLDRLRRMVLPRQERETVAALVEEGLADGRLARSGPWLHLPGHVLVLSAAEEALAARLRDLLADRAEPAWARDLAGRLGCPEQDMRRLLLRLMKRGDLLQVVRDLYLTPALARRYAEVIARLEQDEGAAPAARFRDETGLGRKRAIQLLEFFDRVGYTRRAGEVHRLRGGAAPAMFA